MIVKNFYIDSDSKHLVIEDIIKYLIKNNINYVYIKETNELHFDKYIIRFKEQKEMKEILFNNFLNLMENICDCNYIELVEYKSLISNKLYNNNFKNIKYKNDIKINTKPKTKILKKQLNPTRKIYK